MAVRAPQAAALPAGTNSITACCGITAGGTYVVANALKSIAADCIDAVFRCWTRVDVL